MKFTQSRAKENESTVLNLLQETFGGKWMLNPDEFGVYDISGLDRDNNKALVEVKEREKKHWELWIETKKVRDIAQKYKELNANRALLVCSIEGKHYLYDLSYITSNGTKRNELMNEATSSDINSSGKVEKEVWAFKFDWYIMELISKEVGHLYVAT